MQILLRPLGDMSGEMAALAARLQGSDEAPCFNFSSDWHNHPDQARLVTQTLDDLNPGAVHIFGGDAVSKGPDGRGSLDLVHEWADLWVAGNHDMAMRRAFSDPDHPDGLVVSREGIQSTSEVTPEDVVAGGLDWMLSKKKGGLTLGSFADSNPAAWETFQSIRTTVKAEIKAGRIPDDTVAWVRQNPEQARSFFDRLQSAAFDVVPQEYRGQIVDGTWVASVEFGPYLISHTGGDGTKAWTAQTGTDLVEIHHRDYGTLADFPGRFAIYGHDGTFELVPGVRLCTDSGAADTDIVTGVAVNGTQMTVVQVGKDLKPKVFTIDPGLPSAT